MVSAKASCDPSGFGFQHTVTSIQVPVEASLLAILSVTLIYAGVRLLSQRRDTLAVLFLVSAVIFLILGSGLLSSFDIPIVNNIALAVNRLPVAGMRGILLGVALGSLATGLRISNGHRPPLSRMTSMAETRCPMCGKPNPAGAETCQYCQARIKPLIVAPQPDAAPRQPPAPPETPTPAQPVEPSDQGATDWLSALRSAKDEQDEPPLSDDSSVQDDWLSRLGISSPPAQPAAQPSPEPEDGLPNWLDHFGEHPPQGRALEEPPVWLDSMREPSEPEIQPPGSRARTACFRSE